MAESSDLDVRVRILKEGEDVVADLKQEAEEAVKALEKLSEAPSGDLTKFLEDLSAKIGDFAGQADATSETFSGFLQGLVSAINNAAIQLQEAFPDQSEFLGGIVDALTETVEGLDGTAEGSEQASVGIGELGNQFVIAGQKAQKANDQFTQASAAANPTAGEQATAATLGAKFVGPQLPGPSPAEFEAMSAALKQVGVDFDVAGEHKDKFRANVQGLSGNVKSADAALAQFNNILVQTQNSFATNAINNFNAAAFGVGKAVSTAAVDLARFSTELNQILLRLNPAAAAQATLARETQVLTNAYKVGFITLEQYNVALKQLQANAAAAGKATTGLAGFFNGLKTAILGTALGFTSAQIAIQLFQKTMEAISQGIKDAAQTQQLDTALSALSSSTGVATEEIDKQVKSLEALGFAGSTARGTVVKMVQSELDIADASKLGAAARNQAIVTGKKESEVLETLVNGIANRNARSLRSIGLTINQAAAEDKYAASIDRTSDQLTQSEKQAAIMAAALEQIGRASGAASKGANDLNVVMNKFEVQFAEAAERGSTAFIPLFTLVVKLGSALIKLGEAFSKLIASSDKIKTLEFAFEHLTHLTNLLTEGVQITEDAFTTFAINVSEIWNNVLRGIGRRSRETFDQVAKDIAKRRAELLKQQQARAAPLATASVDLAAAATAKMPKEEDIRASLNALVGPQVKKGFTNLSKEGQEAVDNLSRVFNDFSQGAAAKVVKSVGQVRQALVSAFAKQKTAEDFINFLNQARTMSDQLGVSLKFLEQEGAFRAQADTLKEMDALMTGFMASAKTLADIQKTYNGLVLDGVEHENAMQQITAQVMEDKSQQLALEMQLNAQRLEASTKTFTDAEAASTALFNRRVAETKALGLSEEETARRISVADKELTKQRLENTKVYYADLKQKRDAATAALSASSLALKKLQEDTAKNARAGEQTLRDIERRMKGPEFAARDTRDEVGERQAAVTQALAANNLTRAKEEIEKLKALASQIEGEGGEGATRQRREAFEIVQQTNVLEAELAAKELGFAAEKKKNDDLSLKNIESQLAKAEELMKALGKQVIADLAVKVDAASLTAAQNEISGAFNAPVPLTVVAAPAALENFAKQVQDFLNTQKFAIPLSVTSSGSGGQQVARGGVISGHSPSSTADNIIAWLTAGEYVQPVAAVRHYGTAFMESIRNMSFPRMAEGGLAGGSSSIHAVSSAEKETTLHLTYQGKSLGRVRGSSDTVRDITSALKDLSRGVA